MPEIISMWRSVETERGDHAMDQGKDGTAHFAYYDAQRHLSFIWNGDAEWITVSHGGYGEPICWMVPAFPFKGSPGECRRAFEEHCRSLIPEWDNTIWNDDDFSYSEVYTHCGDVEKHVPIPKGRMVYHYDSEQGGMVKRMVE